MPRCCCLISVRGYYRGTRFDWSGQISSLEFDHHQFVGQWFDHYDPKLHDSIMGPVEEFRTSGAGLGYAESKAGGTFIRIGAGRSSQTGRTGISSVPHLRHR